jgi:hypothetical protein
MLLLLALLVFSNSAEAARKSKVHGDPSELFNSPLGKSDIKNNAYNRCLLIKTLKPGADKSSQATRNNAELLGAYATKLYAQSVKISAYIFTEDEVAKELTEPDVNGETAIIKYEITARLADIARRINIINSFDAATSMMRALETISKAPSSAYDKFRDKNFEYVTECKKLK